MKILSRFKQLKKEIKLIIITVLIMSCIGVYATGTCIIAATADDVTYNNTTVSAALNDLYELTQNYCPPGYECRQLNYVTDCDNKKLYSTKPNTLSGLAKIMAEDSYLDNGQSEYVSSCEGVIFKTKSSDTNGKGIYEIASTKNDTYPIYYYRGEIDNNNVKFGGFCWKAIRTTDTGGVKMIYNGTPDGSGNCTNTTGTSTQIGTSAFNSTNNSPADVGYMYGTRYTYSRKDSSELSTAYVYGKDVTYSGGTYTLTNTMTSTGTWSTDYYTLNNNHYTCFSGSNTCTDVYYIFETDYSHGPYYISLKDGKKIEDALYEMFDASDVNTNDSTIKSVIDTWYSNNLTSYTSYIEDTIYCNDRGISKLAGWDPNGGNPQETMYFNPRDRQHSTYKPTLMCNRVLDRFTVSTSNGNGALTYPVGLITSDEATYAGGVYSNNTYYLYTNQVYWGGSPYLFDHNSLYSKLVLIYDSGSIGSYNGYNNEVSGVRPVISIKSSDVVESGDGTQTNPYVIKTS